MTKSEFITLVQERLHYLTPKDAEIVVQTIIDSMIEAFARGDRIEIRGFGTFSVKNRAAYEGRNPKTGETVHVPAKKLVHFRIGKELYGRINPTVPEEEIS
jgi:integration host factor subunit beta